MTAEAVRCHGCGHGYTEHEPDGGPCRAPEAGPWLRREGPLPCLCAGFRWVDPQGPAVGSYTDPPQRP